MPKQYIITLHGLAQRNPQYAQKLINNIHSLNRQNLDLECIQIYYGDLLQPTEDKFQEKLLANPQYKVEHMKPWRPFINQFIMDMMQWDSMNIRKAIKQRVLDSLDMLSYGSPSLHWVLHSWATVIMLGMNTPFNPEGINKHTASLSTLGCALQLTDLGQNLSILENRDIWTNFYHSDDIIGCPLNTIYGCNDVEIKDAGPPTEIVGGEEIALVGLAHNCYWQSKTIAEHLLNQVKVSIGV
jgi:hypothetical protein